MTQKERFSENIRQCENAMYAVAFSILQNEADASDAVSEAVYRAYLNLHTLKKDSVFKPWILRIVHNTSIEILRKNKKYVGEDAIADKPDDRDRVDLTTKLALRHAVDSLQQPYRTVVELFYYEGLSAKETAEITGVTQTAVRKQLSRARTMLKELLKEDFI